MKKQVIKSILFTATTVLLLVAAQAQKKLVPASQSTLTGITLPAGSKNDSRWLSVLAAKTLLQSEAKKTGASIKDVEVLYLPSIAASGFTFDSLANQFATQGWSISPAGSDNKYAWLQKDNRYIMAYYSTGANTTDLYFGETTATPTLNNSTNIEQGNQNTGNVTQPTQETNNNAAQQNNNAMGNTPPADQSGFTFSTTNFDDGWTSVIQSDWVLVSKADMKVYLWFALPFDANKFTGTGVRERDYYWDNYVTQYFNIETKQYKDDGEAISSFQPNYIEGWATDKQTGERRFIGMRLGIAPNTAYITIASAKDEAALLQQFPKANDKYISDLEGMSRYNKFAIAENDVIGTWQKGNTATAQWYYVSPGGYEGYAGMTVASTSATFNFSTGGNYSSIHNGATGAVGTLNTFQQNFKGNYTVSNWTLTATNRFEGKTDTFDASFSAVRGGRILHLNNNAGSDYSLVKTQ